MKPARTRSFGAEDVSIGSGAEPGCRTGLDAAFQEVSPPSFEEMSSKIRGLTEVSGGRPDSSTVEDVGQGGSEGDDGGLEEARWREPRRREGVDAELPDWGAAGQLQGGRRSWRARMRSLDSDPRLGAGGCLPPH